MKKSNDAALRAENKAFYVLLGTTVLPLLLQSVFTMSANAIDQIMVSSLGTASIAALGACNRVIGLFQSFLYGCGSGCAMFMAQYWGKQDYEGFRKILGVFFSVALVIGTVYTLILISIPSALVGLFADDPEVVEIGAQYLRWVALSILLLAIVFPLEYSFRSMNKVRVTMAESIVSVLTNCFLNYVMIYGELGFPKLGVVGAALATVISRVVALVILIVYIFVSKNIIYRRIRSLFQFSRVYFNAFIKNAVPLISNEMLWNVGTTIYFIIIGRSGTDALAAMSIMSTVAQVAKIVSSSFCGASSIIVGNEIGRGDLAKVNRYCHKFHIAAIVVGILSAAFVLVIRGPVLVLYSIAGTQTGIYVNQCMIVESIYILLNPSNSINVEGIFRSGGDTAFLTLMDMGSIWLVGMPYLLITGLALHAPVWVQYCAYIAVELYKLPLGRYRFRSGKWLHLLYKQTEASIDHCVKATEQL